MNIVVAVAADAAADIVENEDVAEEFPAVVLDSLRAVAAVVTLLGGDRLRPRQPPPRRMALRPRRPWEIFAKEHVLAEYFRGAVADVVVVVIVLVDAKAAMSGTPRETHGRLLHDNHQTVDRIDRTAKGLSIGTASLSLTKSYLS